LVAKWVFREQWSNRTESATGSHRIIVFRGNRERNRMALPIENTSDERYAPAWVLITLISTVIYYWERDVRDNILHVATSYFMQKAVKHKRPRIVFDNSPTDCVLWKATRIRIFRAPQTFFKTRNRRHFLWNIKRESTRNGVVVSMQRTRFYVAVNFCVRIAEGLLQKFLVCILFAINAAGSYFSLLTLCGRLEFFFVNILNSY